MLAYGVALDRLKSPGPYVERKFAPRYAATVYASSTSGVKCSPAVGAATEPSMRE